MQYLFNLQKLELNLWNNNLGNNEINMIYL